MSTTTDTTTATETCPAWCVEHIRPDDVHGGARWGGDTTLHIGADVQGPTMEGRWVVGCAVDGPEPATLDAASDGQMTPDQGRAFAAAIVAACDQLEGQTATGRVARRVHSLMTAHPLDADRLEAVAAALGVDWFDLVRTDDTPDAGAPTAP
ncbi:hypothetical protein GCM10023168_13900 [Fodinibacter luteus]|uniref:Uncharacterized protein n=1 Tax=Fodinibacter luteus TaxID=552064 RepID=A0ABP8KAG5_9MICO